MNTLEELRKKQQELLDNENRRNSGKAKGGNFIDNFIKLEDGDNPLRILPGKAGEMFFTESEIHKVPGQDGGKDVNYHCRKVIGEVCPICELYFALWKEHKELKLPAKSKSNFGNLASKIRAKKRYYVNVISRDHSEMGPKILPMSEDLFKIIMRGVLDKDMHDENDFDGTNVLSLTKGNDFVVRITKQGEFNSFNTSSFRNKKTPAGSAQEMDQWMASMIDLKTLIKQGDYDEGVKIAQNLRSSLDTVSANTGSKFSTPDKFENKGENKEIKV